MWTNGALSLLQNWTMIQLFASLNGQNFVVWLALVCTGKTSCCWCCSRNINSIFVCIAPTVEELTCLATWKDNNAHYIVGTLSHSRATSNEELFRCFVYEKSNNLHGEYIVRRRLLVAYWVEYSTGWRNSNASRRDVSIGVWGERISLHIQRAGI